MRFTQLTISAVAVPSIEARPVLESTSSDTEITGVCIGEEEMVLAGSAADAITELTQCALSDSYERTSVCLAFFSEKAGDGFEPNGDCTVEYGHFVDDVNNFVEDAVKTACSENPTHADCLYNEEMLDALRAFQDDAGYGIGYVACEPAHVKYMAYHQAYETLTKCSIGITRGETLDLDSIPDENCFGEFAYLLQKEAMPEPIHDICGVCYHQYYRSLQAYDPVEFDLQTVQACREDPNSEQCANSTPINEVAQQFHQCAGYSITGSGDQLCTVDELTAMDDLGVSVYQAISSIAADPHSQLAGGIDEYLEQVDVAGGGHGGCGGCVEVLVVNVLRDAKEFDGDTPCAVHGIDSQECIDYLQPQLAAFEYCAGIALAVPQVGTTAPMPTTTTQASTETSSTGTTTTAPTTSGAVSMAATGIVLIATVVSLVM